jgi:tRNA A-37 threonylcarbamoyl transferase component Bud32
LNGKPVVFQWCDVMPAVPLPDFDKEQNAIFTNYDHSNRYGLSYAKTPGGGCIPTPQPDGKGGVFGMYYIANFHTSVTSHDGEDFVDVITQYGKIQEVKLDGIIDWGDMPKLNQTRDTADAAREFNSISVQGNLVMKSALNKQGETLIAREINWYRKVHKDGYGVSIPEIWPADDGKSFIMDKVEGEPIFKVWPALDPQGRGIVLRKIFEQLDRLHDDGDLFAVGTDTVLRDVKIEACDKLLARYREIKDVIKAFGPITHVNGLYIGDLNPEVTIHKLYARLHEHYAGTEDYSMIHGDLQMSNSMIDTSNLEVSFIDPRGYFGKSELMGLPDYDIAKVYYSLSGYDLFNYSRDFHIKELADGHLEFEIPKPNLDGCEDVMGERFWHQHRLWLAVIWIGLAGYIKNDPVKSLCAHYHGLAIAEQIFRDTFDPFKP